MGGVERTAPLELRATGRTLTGEAIRYGERATDRPERFAPGAFQPIGDMVRLNLQHDPAIVLAQTGDRLTVTDTPEALQVRATLKPGAALTLLQRGALGGLSVEFRSLAERRDGGERIIERARLEDIGLVDVPSYAGRLELRRSSGFTLSATIPADARLRCECGGDALCKWATFIPEAVEEMFDAAFEGAVADLAQHPDVIAAFGRYDRPLASVSRGTLRRDGPATVAIDLPDDDNGRAVLAAHESTGVVVRPHLDMAESEYEQVGDTLHYTRATARAFIVSATDAREGWPEPDLQRPPIAERSALVTPRRRLWL